MDKYEPGKIEQKWQEKWEKEKIFSPDLDVSRKPFYNLMMFPYPSAEGLHVGNMYAFTGADIYGRWQKMQGLNVFEPIGLDGFGIHSENYALKIGEHPAEVAKRTEKNFYRQLRATGNAYDWNRTLETYDPFYYKWTQWLFIQMFKNGLAYRGKAAVNWCPSCQTVLADEQVASGICERCKSEVEKRELEQWFFKITDYAERLLTGLEKIDWTERVKIAQRNWIGKSEGATIKFEIKGKKGEYLEVFTTRPDTLFGATFLVVAPEHVLASELAGENKEVGDYVKKSLAKNQQERVAKERKKTGVKTNLYAINPVNGEEIPIWVADYVLSDYGTGAIMAVPAHDERDFQFAKEYNLEIREVISGGDGTLINSGDWNGLRVPKEMGKVINSLEVKSWGKREVHYHLRDWLISRQRYWGPPIPMVYCQKCGWQPVPEEDLPILLPSVEDWKPKGTGKSPLASIESFINVACPECGGAARRETDVSDTFLDSVWYFLRYLATERDDFPFPSKISQDKKLAKRGKWLPVNMYIGGAEHAVLHLMYVRFIAMALCDFGFLGFEEPFPRFYAHGLLISEGAKMSKSRGNVVIPDAYIKEYGADTLRCYLMFLGPFDQGGDFRDTGITGVYRFLKRAWQLSLEKVKEEETPISLQSSLHRTIKKVSGDLDNLRFNTAIAAMMEFINEWARPGMFLNPVELEMFLKILAPFAPHITEELWFHLGEPFSIHQSAWPKFDPKLTQEEVLTIIVQINGKMREKLELSREAGSGFARESEIEKLAMESEKIKNQLVGKKVKKVIFVPGKLINFVV